MTTAIHDASSTSTLGDLAEPLEVKQSRFDNAENLSGLMKNGEKDPSTQHTVFEEDDSDSDDDSDVVVAPDFEVVMLVLKSWETVKCIDGYEEVLAEQIILRMMELDAHVRSDLNLPSIRSPRFHVVKDKIISVLDGLVSFLGPDLEDFSSEIEDFGHHYRSEGFKEYLLSPAVTEGLKYTVPPKDFSPEIEKGWYSVLNFLVSKMI
mmetsp:Transcript_37959/g.78855  ORF Transcript_37959/g.78855 Transcript_37959/m.78855 type:complete len:207 (-) Transcript_37959:2153-2773(-)